MKKPIIIDVLLITCFESFANSLDSRSIIADDRQIKGNTALQVTVHIDKGDKLKDSSPDSRKSFYIQTIEKSRLQKNINGLTDYNKSSYDSRVMGYQETPMLAEMEKEKSRQKVFNYFAIGLLISLITFIIFLNRYYRKRMEMLNQKHFDHLTILKMQNIRIRIGPHFLFNVLSSISHSVHQPELLINKISNLSLLLRKILENIERPAIPLDEELSIVKAFVELQRDKVAPPFNFNIIIEPSIDREMLIPSMIIQIAAENALKHGLMTMAQGPCDLIIKVEKREDGSRITISDNGTGLSNQFAKEPGTGTGLRMVMQAIHFLNSKNRSKILFSIAERKAAEPASPGMITEIVIPDNYSFKI